MSVLVDTCVLREVQHPRGNPAVRARLAALPEQDLYLSVLTVGELRKGIAKLAAGRRRRELEVWLDSILEDNAGRILPVDLAVAEQWGRLTIAAEARGRPLPAIDGLIAATALRHGFAVMTRNTSDFQATGVELINPWEA
ncbi:MAG: type II toxin-antitoxin system VapC family toxin [Phycisphaerae bacterium]